MKWDDFISMDDSSISVDGQLKTDIECPKCGRFVYLDARMILTSYPCKYKYWCSCGWEGFAPYKWSERAILS